MKTGDSVIFTHNDAKRALFVQKNWLNEKHLNIQAGLSDYAYIIGNCACYCTELKLLGSGDKGQKASGKMGH